MRNPIDRFVRGVSELLSDARDVLDAYEEKIDIATSDLFDAVRAIHRRGGHV